MGHIKKSWHISKFFLVDKAFDDRNGSSPYTKLMEEKLISVWEDWVKEGKMLSKIPETNNSLDSRWSVKMYM